MTGSYFMAADRRVLCGAIFRTSFLLANREKCETYVRASAAPALVLSGGSQRQINIYTFLHGVLTMLLSALTSQSRSFKADGVKS